MSSTFRLSFIAILGLLIFNNCKLKPVDAVYYGSWVNTYTEEYSYETLETSVKREGEWNAHFLLLKSNSVSIQFGTNRLNGLSHVYRGKWSTRNNNDLTLQNDAFLFRGTIVLLNEVLTIEGYEYPLDRYKSAIQTKGIKKKMQYHKASIIEEIEYFSGI